MLDVTWRLPIVWVIGRYISLHVVITTTALCSSLLEVPTVRLVMLRTAMRWRASQIATAACGLPFVSISSFEMSPNVSVLQKL